MRNATGLVLGLVFAACALGQMTPPRTYGSPSGFGSVVFPGMGTAPPLTAGRPGGGPVYAGRVNGRAVYGYRYGTPVRPVYGGGARTVVVPYAYPVYVNGGSYGEEAPPPEAYSQPQAQAPTVIINQTFVPETARPLLRDYMDADLPPTRPQRRSSESEYAPSEPSPDDYTTALPAPPKPTVYLIAFRDHSIYSAIAYWMEEDTLNYVTPQGVHNRASLDLVDQELSRQINGERNVDFRLKKKGE